VKDDTINQSIDRSIDQSIKTHLYSAVANESEAQARGHFDTMSKCDRQTNIQTYVLRQMRVRALHSIVR